MLLPPSSPTSPSSHISNQMKCSYEEMYHTEMNPSTPQGVSLHSTDARGEF